MPHAFSDLLAIFGKSPAESQAAFIEAGRTGGPGFGFTPDLRWSFAEAPGGKSNTLRVKDSDGFDLTDFNADRLIEGTIIAAYLVGAERAFVDVGGGEVKIVEPLLEKAVAEAELAELCGESILGTDATLDISVNPRGTQSGKGTQTGYNVRFQISKGPRTASLIAAPVAPAAIATPVVTPAPTPPPAIEAPVVASVKTAPVKTDPAPSPKPTEKKAAEMENSKTIKTEAPKQESGKPDPTPAPEAKDEGDPFGILAAFLGAFGVTILLIAIVGAVFGFLAGHLTLIAGLGLVALVAGHFCKKKSRAAKKAAANTSR